MRAIKLLILGLAASLMLVTQVTANILPDNRPNVVEAQTCEYYKQKNWSIRICVWGSAVLPVYANMRDVITILQVDYQDDAVPIYTTVMVEPNNSILNTQFWGVYLPATGNILVQYPFDDDNSWLIHTIAHEVLHAVWDVDGVMYDEHHTLLYCEGALDKVETFLEEFVDPIQTPLFVGREWQNESLTLKYCGSEIPFIKD